MNQKTRIENIEKQMFKKVATTSLVNLDKAVGALTEQERNVLFGLMDKYSRESETQSKIRDIMTPGDFHKFEEIIKVGYSRMQNN